VPEEIHGPYGYADDIWLCAWIADIVRHELDNDAILLENWDGEAPLLALLSDILAREQDLIGDQRSKILWYTGCDHLVEALRTDPTPE